MHDLSQIRADLAARLDQLAEQVERLEGEQCLPLDQDSGEQAVEREDDETIDAQQSAAAREMKAIRLAIARLDAGHYGFCTACGVAIDAARLEAVPHAAHCIECEREFGG